MALLPTDFAAPIAYCEGMKPTVPSPDSKPISSDEDTVPLLLRGFSVVHAALELLFRALALVGRGVWGRAAGMGGHVDGGG